METKKKVVIADIAPVQSNQRRRIAVNQYGLDGQYIATFNSLNEASLVTKVSYSSICFVIKGKFKQAGGFQWRKATDDTD